MPRGPSGAARTASSREKERLRLVSLRKRRSIEPEELARASSLVEANLASLTEYRRARLIISYCAMGDEVQTRPIIEKAIGEGKRVAVVVADVASKTLRYSEISSFEEDLAPGAYGILEPKPGVLRPVSLDEADVILVPLVAWDESGHRLGHGQGYFDRALARAKRVVKIGLALESQRLQRVPTSEHDVSLDLIVTERRVVRAEAARPTVPSLRKHSKTQEKRFPGEGAR